MKNKKTIRNIREEALGIGVTEARAGAIMGKNFFGLKEAEKYFGAKPTKGDRQRLAQISFSEKILEELKDGYVLVAVLPLSILKIRSRVGSVRLPYGQVLLTGPSWYDKELFAKERGEASWHLVHKTSVSNSTSKNWNEQLSLIGRDDEVPMARVMLYTIIGHYLATGERLFEDIYVRCLDVFSDGRRVSVGHFGSGGLFVDDSWGGSRRDVGLASSRKIQSLNP